MIPVGSNNARRGPGDGPSGDSDPYMNLALRIFIPALLILLLGSCQRSPSTDSSDSSVLAVVGGENILLSDFQKVLSENIQDLSISGADEEAEAFKEALLEQMVTHRLFLAEAHRRGLTVGPEELESAIDEMKGDYSESDFDQLMDVKKIGKEAWKDKLAEEILVQKLVRIAMDQPVTVSEDEVNHYYDIHRNEFQNEETVHARQIVVPTDAEAHEIRELLTEGQDFEEIARARSISPDAADGGDLGFFRKGEMPEEFDVVFDLPVGEISPVIHSPFGYHLFKVEEHRPPSTLEESEAKEKIRELLIKNKQQARYDDWVADLRQKADIRINRSILKMAVFETKKKEKVL
jgi:peptidyl-prolyl cis-trans isomerase C